MPASVVLLSVLFGLLHITEGQLIEVGRCPAPPVQENFDISKYVGKWYEIEKLPAFFEKGICIQTSYTLKDNGKVEVMNEELRSDGKNHQIEVEAIQADDEPAKLSVNFSRVVQSAPYWVLSTDYGNYTLVYSCVNFPLFFHVEFAWILSRTRQLQPETVQHLKGLLRSYNINADKMRSTVQMNCPPEK